MLPEAVPFDDALSSLPPISGSLDSCLSIDPIRADVREHSRGIVNALVKGPGITILKIPSVAAALENRSCYWNAVLSYSIAVCDSSGSQEPVKDSYTATNSISPSGNYFAFSPASIGELEGYLSGGLVDIAQQSATPVADHLSLLRAEIDELGSLGDDWNCEGAVRIDSTARAQAKALIVSAGLIPGLDLPSIGPLPDGRVSLTWEFEQKELWVYASAVGFTSYQWNTQQQLKSDVSMWQEPSRILEFLEWLMK